MINKTAELTDDQLRKARAIFQDHINEGSFEPGHMDRCGYCQSCRVAIILIDEELFDRSCTEQSYKKTKTVVSGT